MKNKESLTDKYITEALIQLTNKKSFNKITVKEIAEKAGVSRITFYRHFDSKMDIIEKNNSLISQECNAIKLVKNNKEYLEKFIFNIFSILFNHKDYLKFLYSINLEDLILRNLDKQLEKYGIHTTYRRAFYTGGFYHVILEWVRRDFKEDAKYITNEIMDIIKQDL